MTQGPRDNAYLKTKAERAQREIAVRDAQRRNWGILVAGEATLDGAYNAAWDTSRAYTEERMLTQLVAVLQQCDEAHRKTIYRELRELIQPLRLDDAAAALSPTERAAIAAEVAAEG